jgi:hypothetical protein
MFYDRVLAFRWLFAHSIVSFFKLSPTVYLFSLLKSFVNWKIANSKSYVALYTGNSLYCAIPKKIDRFAEIIK